MHRCVCGGSVSAHCVHVGCKVSTRGGKENTKLDGACDLARLLSTVKMEI